MATGHCACPDSHYYDDILHRGQVGTEMKILPESYRRLLTPEQRREIGQPTIEESKSKGEVRIEKDLQRLIYLELTRRGLFFHYSRMDKKTRSAKGTPDFAFPIRKSGYIAIECKTSTGSLTEEQAEVRSSILKQGGDYTVVRTFDEFLNLMKYYEL